MSTIWDNRPVHLWNKIDWIYPLFQQLSTGPQAPRGLQHLEKKIGLSNKAKSKTLNLTRELLQLPLVQIKLILPFEVYYFQLAFCSLQFADRNLQFVLLTSNWTLSLRYFTRCVLRL